MLGTNAQPKANAAPGHPPLTIADSAEQARHRVWHLLAFAFVGVAVPLAIGGYALCQAAASQRVLIETSRLAEADVLAAHVSSSVLDLRKDVIALSKESGTSSALSLRDGAGGLRSLDVARGASTFYGALALLDAEDEAVAVSPGTAGEVFKVLTAPNGSRKPPSGLRRDGQDVVWVMRFTVRDAAGKRVGSLAAAISLEKVLLAHTHSSAKRKPLAKSLVDRKGEILVSTDSSWQGKQLKAPEILGALATGKRTIIRHHSVLHERAEMSAIVPVVQSPFLVLLSQATSEADAPLVLVERWLWLGFLALTLSSAGMFWHALRTFRHYDRRLIRECSLATGVIDGTSDMVFVKDSEGRYLLVNEPGASFLNQTKEGIVGRTVGEVMTPEDAARTLKNDMEVLESGRGTKREFRGTDTATGKPYVVWTARHPLRDRQGVVAAVVGVTRDVTERHKLVDALRDGEQRLRLIVDNLPALVAYIDRDERYQFANKMVSETLGADAPSVIGRTLQEVVGEEIYADQTAHLAAVLRGELVTFEGKYAAGGRQHIYRSTYVPDVGTEGEVRGFYAMTFDITDSKTIEMLLAASEAKVRLIADNLPALVSYIDRERRFSFNNAAYAEWLGRPVHEITGRLLREVMDERLMAMVEPHIDEAFGGKSVEFEFASPLTGRFVRGTYIPDRDADGDVRGVYGFIYDITEQKLTEFRLREQAQIDSLTGLPNRRRLNLRLVEAIARSERSGQALAVMFLDLDYLKTINDTFGHEGGDLALQEFARRLSQSVRITDTVARVSGDEFVVVLESVEDAAGAATVANTIAASMQEPVTLPGGTHVLSASIGIALRRAGEMDGDELVRRADHALYAVKGSGRGGFLISQ